jgi:hypothetical protein
MHLPDERRIYPTNVFSATGVLPGARRTAPGRTQKNRPAEPGGKNFFQGQLLLGFYPKDWMFDFSGLDYWFFRIRIGLLRWI